MTQQSMEQQAAALTDQELDNEFAAARDQDASPNDPWLVVLRQEVARRSL